MRRGGGSAGKLLQGCCANRDAVGGGFEEDIVKMRSLQLSSHIICHTLLARELVGLNLLVKLKRFFKLITY